MSNKKFKIILIWISSLFIIFPDIMGSLKKPLPFQLPVRISNGEEKISRLGKNNFKLIINNEPRKITGLQYRQKSIEVLPELGRYFILSFHISEFNKQIKMRISYLVTEILNTRDTLFVISPIKILQFKTYPNKDRMIREINSLLEKDFSKHQKDKITIEKNLKNKINQLNELYIRTSIIPGLYSVTHGFLNTFPQEFSKYKKYYLSPAVDKYQQIVNLLQLKEGERWLIHFHDNKIYDILFKTIVILKKINEYIHSQNWQHQAMGLSLSGKLDQFKKQLSIAKSYPVGLLMNIILKGYINYNVIFFGGMKDINQKTSNMVVSDLETVLKEVTRHSGGVAVHSSSNLQEMKTIKNHQDFFYNLSFCFNRIIEAKKIQILLMDQNSKNLSYRNIFEKEEIKSLVHYIDEKKVKISHVSVDQRSIDFKVKSFVLQSIKNTSEIFGLLRINIQIRNQNRAFIFESKKTLRATKEELAVSLKIPGQHTGIFNLSISVIDLVANSQTSIEQKITLK